MIAKIHSAIPSGYSGTLIEVEGDINHGLPAFNIVGMAAKTVSEARERVKSGLNINPDEASRDFIGPNSTEAKTNRLIRTMFSFEDDFERYKEAFYEWRDSQNSARFEANPQAKAIRDKMLEIGNEWYSEPDYNQLADAMRELSKLKY